MHRAPSLETRLLPAKSGVPAIITVVLGAAYSTYFVLLAHLLSSVRHQLLWRFFTLGALHLVVSNLFSKASEPTSTRLTRIRSDAPHSSCLQNGGGRFAGSLWCDAGFSSPTFRFLPIQKRQHKVVYVKKQQDAVERSLRSRSLTDSTQDFCTCTCSTESQPS